MLMHICIFADARMYDRRAATYRHITTLLRARSSRCIAAPVTESDHHGLVDNCTLQTRFSFARPQRKWKHMFSSFFILLAK